MKTLILSGILILSSGLLLSAQRQLEIQGSTINGDTVATIRANYAGSGSGEVIGLYVKSNNDPLWGSDKGIAGIFDGNVGVMAIGTHDAVIGTTDFGRGVKGESNTGDGIYGYSNTGNGIRAYSVEGNGIAVTSQSGDGISAQSSSGYGVKSKGGKGSMFEGDTIAIELGGSNWVGGNDDGVIASLQGSPGSDIFLVANDAVVIQLDNDKNSLGTFEIWNQNRVRVFETDEAGNVDINGYVDADDVRCQGLSICFAFSQAMAKIDEQQLQINALSNQVAKYEALAKRMEKVELLLQREELQKK